MKTKNPLPEEAYLKRTHERCEDIRGPYFRDQTAIIHSLPFRRLKHKTQVFFAPENDHICTRIEHVLHVATISATICKGLNIYGWDLSPELAYAIGLGHDLGHPPFGHFGEDVLQKQLGENGKFMHELNSYRVVEYLANDGKGLNLTYAVKDGIINHNGEKYEKSLKPSNSINNLDEIKNRTYHPSSFEGCIVRYSDKIAYLGRDIEDAITAKLINIKDIPEIVRKALGQNNGEIINTLIIDIIEHSKEKDYIGFSENIFSLIKELYKFNFEHIYFSPIILNYKDFAQNIISELFEYLLKLHSKYGEDYNAYEKGNILLDRHFANYINKMKAFNDKEGNNPLSIITDFVSGMTDNYALESFKQIKIPAPINLL